MSYNFSNPTVIVYDFLLRIIPSFNKKWRVYDIEKIETDNQLSIFHFKVKHFNGWQFGIWVDSQKNEPEHDNEDFIHIFMQHKDWIDHFSPAHSLLCVGIDKWTLENEEKLKFPFYNLYNMLIYVKKHPLMAYNQSQIGNGIFDLHELTIKEYASNKYNNWWKFNRANKIYTKLALWYTKTKIQLIKLFDKKYIKSIKIIDMLEAPFTSVNPRYMLVIVFNKNATETDECNFLTRWFHKDQYGYRNITSNCIWLQFKNETSKKYYIYSTEKEN